MVHGRSILLLALLAPLSGCATGSSLSLSQAPLSFVLTEDGAYEIEAQQDGTAQALAERGDIEHGIPGYALSGGNALLPVSAAVVPSVLNPASSTGLLGPSLVSVEAGQGQAAVNIALAGQAAVVVNANAGPLASNISSGLASAVGTSVAPVTSALAPATSTLVPVTSAIAPVTAAVAPVTSTITPVVNSALPAVSAAVTTPAVAPVAVGATAPATALANQSLTAVGSVLGAVAPPAAPAATAPGNPILATIAAALGRRCC